MTYYFFTEKQLIFALIRLKESGLQQKMLYDYYPHPPDCKDVSDSGYSPVSIRFTYSAYYILLCGYKLAILILFMEIMASKTCVRVSLELELEGDEKKDLGSTMDRMMLKHQKSLEDKWTYY